ncbi:MAG: cysteine--tRNA ligase [Eubacteriales bacterium]|nr:cysteine--tRNA ligase [Eubacteriales bacterium]
MDDFFLYNTRTRKIEALAQREPGKIRMYTCGPTVYHFAHIGNLRSYVMEDVLEKALSYAGYEVTRAMNITDVGHLVSDADTGEDKMLLGAKREHKSVMEIASFYTDAFFADCEKLNVKRPKIVERATSCIGDYVALIERLFERGYAYAAGGNVYFDTSKLNEYHVLTRHKSGELFSAVRDNVEEDANKRNKADFALWFTKSKFDGQELRWESPWGLGYPGWHIECSAISMKHLGEYLDLHCGGVDNIFPHHTNEIAQSEAALGHAWCAHWFHVHHLTQKSGKMSKSSGEFLTLSLLEERGYPPPAYRYFCLQSHYRKPLEFSFEALDNANAAYRKLLKRVSELRDEGDYGEAAAAAFRKGFSAALCNDLNTAKALSVVYDVIKSDASGKTKLAVLREFDGVFSLGLGEVGAEATAPDEAFARLVEAKIAERNAARARKDFKWADAIRDELAAFGVSIKDGHEGTAWSFGEGGMKV